MGTQLRAGLVLLIVSLALVAPAAAAGAQEAACYPVPPGGCTDVSPVVITPVQAPGGTAPNAGSAPSGGTAAQPSLSSTGVAQGALASTGFEVTVWMALAAGLIGVGAASLLAARIRSRSTAG